MASVWAAGDHVESVWLPMFPDFRASDDISERWAVLDLERTRGGEWWIDYGATEITPEAFPVMIWSA